MKTIRVLTAAVLLIAISLALSGCIIIPLTKYYNIPRNTVSSTDIYALLDSDDHMAFDASTATPYYTLSDNQIEDFLTDLLDIRFEDSIIITIAAVDPSFYYGDWVAQIHYTDGTYELISCAGYGGTYNSDHKAIDTNHYGCDDDQWTEFILKYVPKGFTQGDPQLQ